MTLGRPAEAASSVRYFSINALFRHMSVFENIAFPLRVRPRKSRPSERGDPPACRGTAVAGPTQFAGEPVSVAAVRRAAAARGPGAGAGRREPRVLLLDEPFGALDAKVRQELRTWLRRLHDEMHVTTLFLTHDQEEAFEVADRVSRDAGREDRAGRLAAGCVRSSRDAVRDDFLGTGQRVPRPARSRPHAHGTFLSGVSAVPGDGITEATAYVRPHEVELHRTPHETSLPVVCCM